MDWKRIQAALIRFMWTFVFAFFAQPAIQALATGEANWSWEMAGVAAIAAFVYAVKKFAAPDSIL